MNRLLDKVWKTLASLKTGMVLLLLIAMTNLVGSFVIQEDQAQPGQMARAYSPEMLQRLRDLGLTEIYQSWWFVLLLIITTVSLVVASIDIWPRFFRPVRHWRPTIRLKTLQRLRYHTTRTVKAADSLLLRRHLAQALSRKFSRVWEGQDIQGNPVVYADKGRWSHLAVFVIHAGLVLILVGGGAGTKFGFEGQMKLAEGEDSHLFYDNKGKGPVRPIGFRVLLKDTRVETYENGSPKAYYSDLAVIEDGQIVKEQTIKVNKPMEYRGVYFYQATYGTQGANQRPLFRLEVKARGQEDEGMILDIPPQTEHPVPDSDVYSFSITGFQPDLVIPVGDEERALGPAIQVTLDADQTGQETESFWVLQNFPGYDEEVRQGDMIFYLRDILVEQDIVEFSGFIVGYNPGIPSIWLGSTLMLAGLLWTFWGSHRRLWLQFQGTQLLIGVNSHRREDSFEPQFTKTINFIDQSLAELK